MESTARTLFHAPENVIEIDSTQTGQAGPSWRSTRSPIGVRV